MFTKEIKVWDKQTAIFKLLDYRRGLPTGDTQTVNNNTFVQVNVDKAIVDLRAVFEKHGASLPPQ